MPAESAPTRARSRRRAARYTGWTPFLCVLAAIGLVATSAISWVTSTWAHPGGTAAVNVGDVPTQQGALVSLISPRRIVIPALSESAPIVTVRTLPGGALDIPLNPKITGWWGGGAKPGARKGTAIIAGHINYAGVQGALARIGSLQPNDVVWVYGIRKGKKTKLQFRVTGVRTYSKHGLPYQKIFSQKSVGRLAIVTCGGPFDASTGNYLDNIVVYAVPSKTT